MRSIGNEPELAMRATVRVHQVGLELSLTGCSAVFANARQCRYARRHKRAVGADLHWKNNTFPGEVYLRLVLYGVRYVVGRFRRQLPAITYLAVAADDRLYGAELRWSPAKVHRIIDSWHLSEVCVVRRRGTDVGGGIDALDLRLPGGVAVAMRAVEPRSTDTEAVLDSIGECGAPPVKGRR